MNDTNVEISRKPVEPVRPTGIARRRLLRAGAAAVPVVLTLSGRSAMAGECATGLSPLAWNSLAPDGTNCRLTSHTVTTSTLGVSPGNWKPNGNGKVNSSWPSSCVPYAGYPDNSPVGKDSDRDSDKWATGTIYKNIFPATNAYSESEPGIRDKSVSRILIDNDGTIEWHLCAAYLNAATGIGDVMTAGEVQDACAGKVGSLSLSANDMKAYLNQTWA